ASISGAARDSVSLISVLQFGQVIVGSVMGQPFSPFVLSLAPLVRVRERQEAIAGTGLRLLLTLIYNRACLHRLA
ncbi:MAG: hypothetical protein ACREU8_12910, partial [Gammaproteobacteria bacterium]